MRGEFKSCGGFLTLCLLATLLIMPPLADAFAGNAGGAAAGGDDQDTCPTPDCGNTDTNNQDVRYRDLQIQGAMGFIDNTQPVQNDDNGLPVLDPGLQGAMPGTGGNQTPMYTKNTPTISLVKNFPWLYKEVDLGAQYFIYRGTGNNTHKDVNTSVNTTDITRSEAIASDDDNSGTTVAANVASVDTSDLNNTKCKLLTNNCGAADYAHYERWVRLEYDSCANQYLMPEGLDPAFIFSPEWKGHLYQWNETICQPLKLSPVPCLQNTVTGGGCKTDNGEDDKKLYDYRPWGYLELAWLSVLDSNYTLNGGGNAALPQDLTQNTAIDTDTGGFDETDPLGTQSVGNAPVTIGGSIQGPNIGGQNAYGTPFNQALPGGSGASNFGAYTGALTNPNDLSQHPYERIWDPTHPYSPRWDFNQTDRSYSIQARLTGVPYVGYDTSLSPCIVRCAAVPVDIMSFRKQEFNTCMSCRIAVNTNCFWTEVFYLLTPIPFVCSSDPNAYIDTINDETGCHPVNPIAACKTYYNLQGLWPVCSTKYDYPADNVPALCSACVEESGDSNTNGGVTKCCNDLAQALVPINTLKIRNTQLDPTLLDPITNTVPEGYNFKSYFGNHMPYMRWWDTATAAGGTTDPNTNYNPNCDLGQYDTLVGVGREGGGNTTTTQNANYCRFGGGAGLNYPDGSDCIQIRNPDALTSWTELKQYQSNSLRNFGLNCLPQYEKLYKQYAAEDGVLTSAGGYYNAPWHEPQSTDANSFELAAKPWPLRWRGYLTDTYGNNFPNFQGGGDTAVGLDNAKPGDIIYLNQNDVAPNVANVNIMPFMAIVTGVSTNATSNYLVEGKPASDCQRYVQVVEVNNGKYPDACGNTNFLDLGQTRTIYKDYLPPSVHRALNPTGTVITDSCGDSYTVVDGLNEPLFNDSGNCMDPKLLACTPGCLAAGQATCPKDQYVWDRFRIYRPGSDVRN